MAEAFKPCPFCGGADIRSTRHQGEGRGPWHAGEDVFSMCCCRCGATFPNMYRRELLVEKWNRRAKEPSAERAEPQGLSKDDAVRLAEECGAKVYSCEGEVVFFRYNFHQFVAALAARAIAGKEPT